MKKPLWITAMSIAAALLLGPFSGLAQSQQCARRANVIGHLAKQYKEAPVAIGVTSTGSLVEVLSTGDGTTWTIILSNPNGTSCLIAAGEDWRTMKFDREALDPRV